MNQDPFSLDRLRDLAEPDPIAWWPPAPGWWIVIGISATWAVAMAASAMLRWRRDAYRRAGLRMLDAIEQSARSGGDGARVTAEVSLLLKRVALAAYPRKCVAELSGDEWIKFLDRTGPDAKFTSEPACAVGSASYDGSALADCDSASFASLCQSARTWILSHQTGMAAC